jgi:hypothetical protein
MSALLCINSNRAVQGGLGLGWATRQLFTPQDSDNHTEDGVASHASGKLSSTCRQLHRRPGKALDLWLLGLSMLSPSKHLPRSLKSASFPQDFVVKKANAKTMKSLAKYGSSQSHFHIIDTAVRRHNVVLMCTSQTLITGFSPNMNRDVLSGNQSLQPYQGNRMSGHYRGNTVTDALNTL